MGNALVSLRLASLGLSRLASGLVGPQLRSQRLVPLASVLTEIGSETCREGSAALSLSNEGPFLSIPPPRFLSRHPAPATQIPTRKVSGPNLDFLIRRFDPYRIG